MGNLYVHISLYLLSRFTNTHNIIEIFTNVLNIYSLEFEKIYNYAYIDIVVLFYIYIINNNKYFKLFGYLENIRLL